MNRREFIVNLFGAAGALVALPKLEALVRSSNLDAPAVSPELWMPVYDVTLAEFRRLFDQGYRDYLGQDYVLDASKLTSAKIGFVGRTPDDETVLLAHQMNVGFGDSDLAGDTRRYVGPAAAALAIGSAQLGVGMFAPLEVPVGVDYAALCGPVRLIVDRDPVWHHHMESELLLRFDVLGGRTLAAAAAAERIRQRHLKVRIKERLMISEGTQMRLPS